MSEHVMASPNQLDSSEIVKSYVYTSGDGCYVRLSPTAWTILSGRDAGKSFEELAAELTREGEQVVTAEHVEAAWVSVQARVLEVRQQSNPVRSGFWLTLPLLSRSLVMSISRHLQRAYDPAIAAVLVSFIATGALFHQRDAQVSLLPLHSIDILWASLLYFGSAIMHEFGHASACRRFGAQPSAIGFTLYLVYPAFYSDVSDAWRLRRWQRVIVDVGGMYFQLVVYAGYAIAAYYTQWASFRLALYGAMASIVMNLNPFLKFDGYWVLCDLFGVTNLGRQPLLLARRIVMRLRGRRPPKSRWTPWGAWFLSVYAVAWFVFVAWFLWKVGPWAFESIRHFPDRLMAGLNAIGGASGEYTKVVLLPLLVSTIVIAVALRVAWVLGVRSVFGRVKGYLAATSRRR